MVERFSPADPRATASGKRQLGGWFREGWRPKGLVLGRFHCLEHLPGSEGVGRAEHAVTLTRGTVPAEAPRLVRGGAPNRHRGVLCGVPPTDRTPAQPVPSQHVQFVVLDLAFQVMEPAFEVAAERIAFGQGVEHVATAAGDEKVDPLDRAEPFVTLIVAAEYDLDPESGQPPEQPSL